MRRHLGSIIGLAAVLVGTAFWRPLAITIDLGGGDGLDVPPFIDAANNLILELTALPSQVMIYRPIVLGPIRILSKNGQAIAPQDIQAGMVVQLANAAGQAIGPALSYPITLQRQPPRVDTLVGAAYIPLDALQDLHAGDSFQYAIHARRGGSETVSPTQTSYVIDTLHVQIANADLTFQVPDTDQSGKPTSGLITSGAFPLTEGTLTVFKPGTGDVPTLKDLQPASQFALKFDAPGGSGFGTNVISRFVETPLKGPFRFTLGYAARLDGSVVLANGSSASPFDLAPYCFDPVLGWRIAGRPALDSSAHTVEFTTTKLATCALFPTGPVLSSDLRPRERIITPNGDGINDTVSFQIGDGEEVHLFDIRGRRVRTLRGPNPAWDGRDDDGHIVESGIYIYQYSSQGDRTSGVIAVAK